MSEQTESGKSAKRIVYLDRDGLPERIQLRPLQVDHEWINYANTVPEQVIERSTNADILVINKVKIDDAILSACPSVRHIAVTATGFNVVDLDACQKHHVSASNVPSYATTTVPEHVINLALSLRRQLIRYRQRVIQGSWQSSNSFCLFDKPIHDLHASTLGIIGFGELGYATAKLANAMGMKVIYCSRHQHRCEFAKQVSQAELLRDADIISVHCSLTDQTRDLIGAAELAAMRPHAILINTARGGIVNEAAAVDAIRNNQIGGLGFDVLSQEPPLDDSPLLAIAELSNVIITPHIAWASEQAMQSLADTVIDNIDAFLNGKPQNIVT